MKGTQKISTIVLIALAAVSVILAVLFFFGGRYIDPITEIAQEPKFTAHILTWAAILAGITAIVTLVFSFVGIFASAKSLKSAGIAIGISVVLVIIAYALGSSTPIEGKEEFTASTFKMVDSGLILTYILGGGAIIGIIVSEIVQAFK